MQRIGSKQCHLPIDRRAEKAIKSISMWLLIAALILIGGLALLDPSVLVNVLKNPKISVQSTGPAVVLAVDMRF